MQNLDELVSEPSSPAPQAASTRPIARLARYWDFLAVLLLVGLSIPLAWVSPRTLMVVQHPGTFDDHWVIDAVFKASRGIWFGRDVAFLYGPLAHWLFSAPRWVGLSMGSVYTSYNTMLLWCSFLFGYLALWLLIPEQPAWKRFLLLLVLAIFWAPWDGRTVFGIFLFALFLRGWYAVLEKRLKPVLLGCGAALLVAAAFLYSADTGVYGIAAFLMALAGVAWEGWPESGSFGLYAYTVAAFAVFSMVLVFIINSAMANALDFGFWKRSLALVAVHRWNEPAQMSEGGAVHLLVPLVIGGVLFLLRRVVPADRTVITARTGFLLSAFVFAVLAMQSGLVRSDPNHIVFAVFPMVFFAGTVLFSFRSRIGSTVAALVAVACSILFAQPAPVFRPSSLRYRCARLLHPLTACPGGFKEFDHVCYPAYFTGMLQAATSYLQQHSGGRDSVVIFPYQYMFGMASGRNVAGGVEQSFLSVGSYLSQLDIAAMERAAAPAGLYFPDGQLSIPIDGVANFTRSPNIWFWINRHYRLDEELGAGVFGLKRDDLRAARITLQPLPLMVAVQSYPIGKRSWAVDLGDPAWPIDGADFLRLRLTARYGPLWKLRKPERLQLEITRSDGSRDLQSFVVEPNVSSEVWFYPWDQADLARYFAADESRWRISPPPPITHLRLLVTPLDWVSQQANSIALESADAVRMSTAP